MVHVAKGVRANLTPPQLPLRIVLPAGGAVLAIVLVTALVGPSLVGGEATGTGAPAPAPAGPLSSATTTTLQTTCATWTRDWRDHCESVALGLPETPDPSTTTGTATTTTLAQIMPIQPVPPSPPNPSPSPPVVLSSDWVPVVAKASPAVVKVTNAEGSGTGFVIDTKGHIVTNWHVVDAGPPYRVRTVGGRLHKAKLVGTSSQHDIAVLKVSNLRVTPLKWSGTKPKIGQGVLVLGFPGGDLVGAVFSATQGIVSGLNRDTNHGRRWQDMVQYDAATNHGNSGGPILDSKGRIVAVVSLGETASNQDPDTGRIEPGQQDMNYGVLGTNAQKTVKKLLS
jgi:S1-C subfamily serine protease